MWRDEGNVQTWRGQAMHPGTRSFGAIPTFELDSFERDVALELDAVARAGCGQVVVIDLTRPELAIPVVRVIVPGLHDQGHRHGGRRPAEAER